MLVLCEGIFGSKDEIKSDISLRKMVRFVGKCCFAAHNGKALLSALTRVLHDLSSFCACTVIKLLGVAAALIDSESLTTT